MLARAPVITALSIFAVMPPLAAQHALNPAQKEVVSTWIAKHPGYRIATDRDCACGEDLQKMRREGYGGRWKPIPDYHPYQVAGDFNGDGEPDFAVAVVRTNRPHEFTILVFNGPFRRDEGPSFVDAKSNMVGIGFFYGPPRPKPYRLVVSAFESEGYVLVPKGKTYRLEPISSENE